nr:MAG TPA: hypothetical protein [Caudoviricetes sp.]
MDQAHEPYSSMIVETIGWTACLIYFGRMRNSFGEGMKLGT